MDLPRTAPAGPLNECGCCEGIEVGTPTEVYNRPGLSAIAYRIGTHARFKRSMLARLSDSRLPVLRDLNTRDDDDFAVALLDVWATIADVLTFYSERIANESYLRTATERASLLQLARLIGYELRPGVAASAHLAFELEDTPGVPGVPRVVSIDAGTKVQSLPGQDELPRSFETVERIEARPEWNTLRPRQTIPTKPDQDDTEVYLKGVTTGLSPGDGLLLVGTEREDIAGNENWDFRRLKTVTADPDSDRTRVTWDRGLGWRRFGQVVLPAGDPKAYALRQRAALFGHNAPDWRSMPDSIKDSYVEAAAEREEENGRGEAETEDYTDWPGFEISSDDTIDLDAVYPRITQGSWVVLSRPNYEEVYQAETVEEASQTNFTLTAKTTRLELRGENLIEKFGEGRRDTVVFAQSETLEIAEYPLVDPVQGDEVLLDRRVDDLAVGRTLIFSGEDVESGEPRSEPATLLEAVLEDGLTRLRLTGDLAYSYRRDTLTIHANVAHATHGESRQEVLGSGDASTAFQRFVLRESPLTHTSAPTPSGTESTLEVRVNDIEWHEVPDLYGRGPEERVYTTRLDEEDRTTVQFGDGRSGARLPTGRENVRAAYRKGIGSDGLVRAEQLSLLMTPVLSVRSVRNPLATSGADDPESQDDARRNAPLTVLTLDRIVSLRDYEDFARAYAGIAKALATWLWTGETREVFLTVAGPAGREVGGELLQNLVGAIRAAGDRHLPLRVEEYRPAFFGMVARMRTDPDYIPERVKAAVAAALQEQFGFDARSFGQGVALSEVLAAIQTVPGVVMVDVDELYRIPKDEREEQPQPFLEADVTRPGEEDGDVPSAELLTLDPEKLSLEVIG
jgi:predicted phage baseplate assembly protein